MVAYAYFHIEFAYIRKIANRMYQIAIRFCSMCNLCADECVLLYFDVKSEKFCELHTHAQSLCLLYSVHRTPYTVLFF